MGKHPSRQISGGIPSELDAFPRRHNRNPFPVVLFSLLLRHLDHPCRQVRIADEAVRFLCAELMPLLDVLRQARRLYECDVQPAVLQPQKSLGMLEIVVSVGKARAQYLHEKSRFLPIQDGINARRGQDQDLWELGVGVCVADVAESGDDTMSAVFDHAHAWVADIVADHDEDGVGAAEAVCDQGNVVQCAFKDLNVLVESEFRRQLLKFSSGAGVGMNVVLGGLEEEIEEGLACRTGCTEDCVGRHGGGGCREDSPAGLCNAAAMIYEDNGDLERRVGVKIRRCESMTTMDGLCDQWTALQNPRIAKTVVICHLGHRRHSRRTF